MNTAFNHYKNLPESNLVPASVYAVDKLQRDILHLQAELALANASMIEELRENWTLKEIRQAGFTVPKKLPDGIGHAPSA